MCDIAVEWLRATRPRDVQKQVCSIYRLELLYIFHSAEQAKKARDAYAAFPRPFMDWPHANEVARCRATKNLTPSEQLQSAFKVSFP